MSTTGDTSTLAEGERRSFIGTAGGGTYDDPASLQSALTDAAERAVKAGAVTKERGPVWYDVTRLEAEIANQHVKTFRVTITPQG